MIRCPKCREEVKYIVSKDNEVLIVDVQVQNLVTEKGRILQGYKFHECKMRQ